MYVPMRNLIQCMGDMALMPKKMWKIANFGWFFMIFGTFGAPKGPYILLKMPFEWLFYRWDTQSCMHQWEIWFNVRVMWLKCANYVKNSRFLVIFDDFLDIWSQITSPILHQEPNEWLFYLRDIPFCIFQGEIRFIVRVICLLFQKCVKKIAHFWWFLRFLWHRGP